MRRALLFASPFCAAVAILPGPCTTFDNVSEPATDAGLDAPHDDHVVADASDAGPAILCEGGVRFVLEASVCQDLFDRGCCIPEQECARSACGPWVDCVNRCPIPREAGCIVACGPTSSFPEVLKSLSDCRTYADAEALCPWP
jgi:hypothetical protein